MAAEGAPIITPTDVIIVAGAIKKLSKLFKSKSKGLLTEIDRDLPFLKDFRNRNKPTTPPVTPPGRVTLPPVPPIRPAPVITAPTATSPPPSIPDQVGQVFKGTKLGKAAGAIRKGGEAVAKGGVRGSVAGTAVILGVEAVQILLKAIQDQKDAEDKLYRNQTKKQQKEDNAKIDEIRRKQREEDIRLKKEQGELDRQAAMARTQAIIKARDDAAAKLKTERDLNREATNRANAKLEEQRQLEKEERDLQAQAARAAKAGRAALIKKVQTYASLAGLLISLRSRSKRSGGRASSVVEPTMPPTTERPRRTLPGRPDFSFRPAEPTFGTDFGSLDFSTQFAASKTTVATKTKVAKCRSDTPKRKKGRCRTGFFRETPNKTTYKVWSERKCL